MCKRKEFVAYEGNYFTVDKKIIITEGFLKKSDKLPSTVKTRSLQIKKEYLIRVEKGCYYE